MPVIQTEAKTINERRKSKKNVLHVLIVEIWMVEVLLIYKKIHRRYQQRFQIYSDSIKDIDIREKYQKERYQRCPDSDTYISIFYTIHQFSASSFCGHGLNIPCNKVPIYTDFTIVSQFWLPLILILWICSCLLFGNENLFNSIGIWKW